MDRAIRLRALLTLALLPPLAGCPKRPQPDYDSVRQRAKEAHQDLDQQKAP